MHVPRAERAARWRAQAQVDLDAAERLANDLWQVACFHAQQASEKALKAVLARLQGDATPTHLAQVLLGALADLGTPPPEAVARAANALDRFYVPTRYPDALDFADAAVVFSVADARQALEWAHAVLRWCDETIVAATDEGTE